MSTEVGESSQHHSDAADSDGRPAKRHKVAAACDQCRDKKIKCDGEKPICSPCHRRFGPGTHCEWGARKTRSVGASTLEIVRLRARIDELERMNRRQVQSEPDEQSSPASPQSASDMNPDSGANAMMGLMEGDEHGEESTVGDSSAASFMNRVKAVLDQKLTPEPAQQAQSTSSAAVTNLHRFRRFKTPDYILPSRQQSDKLVEVYWRLVDPLYPFIEKEDFMGKYRSLWTGNPTMDDEICFICLLNAMLAVGCLLDSTIAPGDRVGSGQVYFKRAQAYVDLNFLQLQSVHTVQCLLLLAQYLQSTREPQQCWMFAGLAIRIAQSLGLDLPSTSVRTATGNPDDFLRRLWHGCILMDRTLSMTFGRPTIITPQSAASVPQPLPHPDGVDCVCNTDPFAYEPASLDLHFFLETLKLYEIMSETLVALYSAPPHHSVTTEDSYTSYFGSLGAKAAGTILEIDSKYCIWRKLPFHLRYTNAHIHKSMTYGRQARVLHLRYCHVRTLLFRPVLLRFCLVCHRGDEVEQESLQFKLALQCSVMCVQSALSTVELIDKVHAKVRLELLDGYLPAWWYCILYLYTAATVLVAAKLIPTIETEVGGKEVIMCALRTVIATLNRYGSFGKHAKRCAAAIELLFKQVPRQTQYQKAQMQSGSPDHNTGLATDANTDFLSRSTVNRQLWPYAQQQTSNSIHFTANPVPQLPEHPAARMYSTDGGQASIPTLMEDSSFEPSDLSLDLDLGNDMSWLSSIPFDLYSEQT